MYAEWMKNISLKVTEEDIKQWREKQKSRRRSKRNGGNKCVNIVMQKYM